MRRLCLLYDQAAEPLPGIPSQEAGNESDGGRGEALGQYVSVDPGCVGPMLRPVGDVLPIYFTVVEMIHDSSMLAKL
jgi:hypothetical protein